MPMNLYAHPDIDTSDPEEIDEFRWRIEESITKDTPWVKSLTGPYGDTLRVKFGKRRRALFSWGVNEVGDRSIWIHELGWRREIYDRDLGIARADAWNRANNSGTTSDLGYVLVPGKVSPVAFAGRTQLRPALSAEQAAFVRLVLPIDDNERSEYTFILRADGPPGSGKTVAAAECASDGLKDGPNADLENPGCDVVVLAPSGSLVHHYREALRDDALAQGQPFAAASASGETALWVEHFDDFFDAFGAPRTPFDQLLNWWRDTALALPALSQWSRRHPCVGEPRFVSLLDACFGDGTPDGAGEPAPGQAATRPQGRVGGGSKDALAIHDAALFAALSALSAGERRAIEQSRTKEGIRFRWESARAATEAIQAARPGRTLLFVVDETQDLIPAQWRALVSAAFARNDALRQARRQDAPSVTGGLTILAMLGDENQRVAPTAFAWTALDEYVRALHPDLATGAGVASGALKGSFRIRRAVAAAANPLVDGSLGADHARRARVAGADDVDPGGRVVVVRTNSPDPDIEGAFAAIVPDLAEEDRVVCIGTGLPRTARLDAMDVREAKGLEYPSVVVTSLLVGGLDWDTRSRAYVALTRTRDEVLVLITDREWDLIGDLWTGVVDHAERDALPVLLRDFVVRAGQGNPAEEQVKRIGNLLDRAEQENADVPVEVLERAARLVDAANSEVLVGYLVGGSPRRNAWRATVLRYAGDAGRPTSERIAAWLLLGDIGAALRCARAGTTAPRALEALERMGAEDGALTAASLYLREERQDAADGDIVDLMRARFAADLQRITTSTPPVDADPEVAKHDLSRKRRTDYLARAVLEAIGGLEGEATDESERFVQRVSEDHAAAGKRHAGAVKGRRASKLLEEQLRLLDRLVEKVTPEEKS
jgi:hypothetical protein